MELNNLLSQFYESIDEEGRLYKDNSHNIELITTLKYIDKYLKTGDRILEIGAATGTYSLYYADKGYQVDAIDLVQHNIDILKSKITKKMNINANQGTALDLSRYEDNTFDITLCFGPLYHIFTDEDITKAINEAIRVTKPNGIVYIAYITQDATMVRWGINKGNIKEGVGENIGKDYKLINRPSEIFYLFFIEDFNNIMKKYDIISLHTVATDGISPIVAKAVNELDEESYKTWVNYHLSACERPDLAGYSSHILYIGRKK